MSYPVFVSYSRANTKFPQNGDQTEMTLNEAHWTWGQMAVNY
jgi:hypothetical protein